MESSQRPTPETAAAIYTATFGTVKHTAVHPNVAIKLERERDEAREEIAAMRGAIREARAALGGCLKYILRLPLSGSDAECETMDDAHHALRKLQPFLP